MEENIKVLFVDDEASLLEQAKLFLEKENERLDVTTTPSAEKALELMERESYDVVISDYQMPRMDGLEFLEIVRKDRNSDIPFIIFTGKGREEVAMKALNLGADRYLQKGGSPKSQYGVLADAVVQEFEHYHSHVKIKEKEKELSFLELAVNKTDDFKIAVVGEDYRYKTVNDWYTNEYDYEADEIVGMTVEELMGEETFKEVVKPHLDEALDGDVSEYSSWFDFPSGKKFMEVSYYPLQKSNSVAIVIHDITDRKEYGKELEEKKAYLEHVPEFIVALDEKGEIKYWSPTPSNLDFELLDFDEVVDNPVFDLVHPEDRETTMDIFEKAVENPGKEFSAEIRGKAKEGWIWFEARAISLLDDPEVESVLVTGREISERKGKEKELEESRKRLEKALDEAPYPMMLHAEDGEVIDINNAWREITGYSLEEIPTISDWAEKAYGERKEDVIEVIDALHEEEDVTSEGESEIKTKEGENRIWEFKSADIGQLPDGRNLVLSIARDVTEQKEMEEELKRKEVYLEHTPEFISVIDEEGEVKYYSHPSSESDVIDPSEVMGSSGFEFVHPEDREEMQEMFFKALENPDEEFQIEARGKTKDGWRWFEAIAVNHLDDPEIEGIIVSGRDVTERREAERRLDIFTSNMPDLMVVLDEEARYVDVLTPEHPSLLKSEEEILGKRVDEILPIEESERFLEFVEEVIESEVAQTIEYSFEMQGETKFFEARARPVTYGIEKENYIITVIRDITERKKVEQREEFLHSLLRHDMNNNLQLIDGYFALLEDIDLPEEGKEFVEKGNVVLKNTKGLIEKIRKLRELDEEEISDVEIDSIISSAISKNKDRLENESIDLKFEEIERKVKAGPLLEEVFSNLIENSIRHAECERIEVVGKDEGDEAVISLEDDGKGIPDDIKNKIFDRGFKKGEEAGSGLGMYLVKEIVESYGGSVEVKDSELGGARFDVYLKRE